MTAHEGHHDAVLAEILLSEKVEWGTFAWWAM